MTDEEREVLWRAMGMTDAEIADQRRKFPHPRAARS
jgi:hypothetical protein